MPDQEIRVFELVSLTVPPKGIMGDKFRFWNAVEVFPAYFGTPGDRCEFTTLVACRKGVGYMGQKVQCDNIHEDKGNNVLFLKGARQFGQHTIIKQQRAVVKANRKARKHLA